MQGLGRVGGQQGEWSEVMPAANGVKRSVTLSRPELRDTQGTQEQFTLTHSCCTSRNEALQACTFCVTCAQVMAMYLQSNFYTTICTRFSSAYSLDLKFLNGQWNSRTKRNVILQRNGSAWTTWWSQLKRQMWFLCPLIFFGCGYAIDRLAGEELKMTGAG